MSRLHTEGLGAAERSWADRWRCRRRFHAAAAIGLVLLLVPAPAWACPVCGMAGTADNAWAYIVMTVMLTALPLGMIGGAVYWVSRRVAAHEAWTEADLPAHGSSGNAVMSQSQSASPLTATPSCDVRNVH